MKPEKKVEHFETGCAVQGLALLAPFVGYGVAGAGGAIVGVVIFFLLGTIGDKMTKKWLCPDCQNPLASKDVKVCPACHIRFD